MMKAAIATLFLAGAVAALGQTFIWNGTASVPVGLYVRTFDPIEVGSTVSFPAPPIAREYAILRGGMGHPTPFIKALAAGPGDEVCVFETETGRWIILDNKIVLSIHQSDKHGNAMPTFMMDNCRKLAHDEWLPMGMHPDSFDGRYFGPIKAQDINGSYEPLMIFE